MKSIKLIFVTALGVLIFFNSIYARDISDVVGKSEFMNYCASCHGSNGKGDGPIVNFLKQKPPDLTKLSNNNNGHFPFDRIWKVFDGSYQFDSHGSSEMPIWGYKFIRETQNENEPNTVAKAKALDIILYIQVIQE